MLRLALTTAKFCHPLYIKTSLSVREENLDGRTAPHTAAMDTLR